MKKVDLYTDGACSGNPGAGGYGAILIYNGVEKEISGGELSTTNNRMEIYAVIASQFTAIRRILSMPLTKDGSRPG